jgi:hypothetical protein
MIALEQPVCAAVLHLALLHILLPSNLPEMFFFFLGSLKVFKMITMTNIEKENCYVSREERTIILSFSVLRILLSTSYLRTQSQIKLIVSIFYGIQNFTLFNFLKIIANIDFIYTIKCINFKF